LLFAIAEQASGNNMVSVASGYSDTDISVPGLILPIS